MIENKTVLRPFLHPNRIDDITEYNLLKLKRLLPENPRILYIGASSDRILNKYFKNVVNSDISGDWLSSGDIKTDANELPFKDGSFDLIFFRGMPLDISTSGKVIKEVSRVLKSGGCVCISRPYSPSKSKQFKFFRKDYDVYKEEQLISTKAYKKKGFKKVLKKDFKRAKELTLLRKGE